MDKNVEEVMNMLYIIILLIAVNAGLLYYMKKREAEDTMLLANKIESSVDLKRTMAMGLYYRFNFPRQKSSDGHTTFENGTELFIKQLPYEFEDFVAAIFAKNFDGDVFVTSRSGDFGVDFELMNEKGLFLGQTKAEKKDIGYEPIAILHSNMIKRNAVGGYLITTSQYTPSAQEYAESLNIVLIDGVQLVELWLETLNNEVYSYSEQLTPSNL